jgi:PAS domain S-box-containing protein
MTTIPENSICTLPIDHLLAGLGPAVLKSIRDPFAIFSSDFRILWINRAMAAIHQQEPEDCIGKICHQKIWDADRPCYDCPIEIVRATGRVHVFEKWHDFPDGTRRCGEIRAYPVRGENKSVSAVIFMIIEITDKKQTLHKQKSYSEYLSKQLNQTFEKDKKIRFDDGDITLTVNLSHREIEVLRLMAEGYTNVQIAERLSISLNTVKSHVLHIFNKLGVNDRTQTAVLATRHNLL